MKRGLERGYFPVPAKSLFISNTPEKEEAAKQEFAEEGLTLNFVSGSSDRVQDSHEEQEF